MTEIQKLIHQIKNNLEARERNRILDPPTHYRHAAVLIPLIEDNGDIQILFTKRTDLVEHHKGQISFPGGAVEPDDVSTQHTALREVEEEIGIRQKDVRILGRIDDLYTVASAFVVHPFVGMIPKDYEFEINPAEVSRIFDVPWQVLFSQHTENRTYSLKYQGKLIQTPGFEYDGEIIWGATARMLKNFFEILR